MTTYVDCDFCNGAGCFTNMSCPKCRGKGQITLTEYICAVHIGQAGWAAEDMKIICIQIDENGREIISGIHDA